MNILRIPNEVIDITKSFLEARLTNFTYILLDGDYKLAGKRVICYSVFSEDISFEFRELERFENNLLLIRYYPKSIFNKLDLDLIKKLPAFPTSQVIRDKDRFLVNLKPSFVYISEKFKININQSAVDRYRWEITNLLAHLKVKDSIIIRYKLIEKIIALENQSANLPVDPEVLPIVLDINDPADDPRLHSEILSLDQHLVEEKVITLLEPYGSIHLVLESEEPFLEDRVVINFQLKDESLDVFLSKAYQSFISSFSRYAPAITFFYFERADANNYHLCLTFNAKESAISFYKEARARFPENFAITVLGNYHKTIYDYLDKFYLTPLHEISRYLLEIRYNENESLTENICVAYALDYYLSVIVELGIEKNHFYLFNKYLSQKWHPLLLSEKELFADYYTSSDALYKSFEHLYTLNKLSIFDNLISKIEDWKSDTVFLSSDIFSSIKQSVTNQSKTSSASRLSLSVSNFEMKDDHPVFHWLEGFLFKMFGAMGLKIEMKLFILYVINQISNED